MKNNIEGGSYLRGQKGEVLPWVASLAATMALLYYADTAFIRGGRTAMNEPDFPQGAQEQFKPAAKFTVVYEGQQEPKCPGDVEKTEPIINKVGKIRGMKVICKPSEIKPAQ